MKSRLFLILLFFIFLKGGNNLFAFGRKQVEEEREPINAKWTLCITEFDTTGMSPAWQTAGDTVARSLAGALQNLDFRFRGTQEGIYYRNYAWAKSRGLKAEELIKARNDRDLLLFKGDAEWKYQKDLKASEDKIKKLTEELAIADDLVPIIENKPVFVLNEKNTGGVFPQPPKSGEEYRFCTVEKADAFLTGSLSEYYGRIYLEIKMYTLYTKSYSFENNMLFSSEDFDKAISEISSHLAAVVSDALPAAILVHSTPPDAMVTIDGNYAAYGEMEMLTPGISEIAIQADKYVPFSLPLELNAGEIAEIFIELTPLGLSAFTVDVPEKSGVKVFLGSLYVGETPLTLELPRNEFAYISVETQEGEVGSVIMKDNELIRGNAQFDRQGDDLKADFITGFPISKEEKRVENIRKSFYSSYGAFWIILPAALLASGIAGTYIAASNNINMYNLFPYGSEQRTRMADNAALGGLVQNASYGFIGASLGLTFFRIYKYLSISTGDATPIVKDSKEKEE